jgi:hypothetical protein
MERLELDPAAVRDGAVSRSSFDWVERRSQVTAGMPCGMRRVGETVRIGERGTAMGFRVIVTTGLATLYVLGCLAALSLLLSMWSASL